MTKTFERFYHNLQIGVGVRAMRNGVFEDGVVMDKYLRADNVYIDVLFNNGKIAEFHPCFSQGQPIVSFLTT